MDQKEIQQKVEAFLATLDVPGFIVFGYQNAEEGETKHFNIISSYNKMPANAAIKGLSQALNDFVHRTLK